MAPPVDANTTRAPASRAASSTFTVPSTLIVASRAGSATETLTSAWAARWTIASVPVPADDLVQWLANVVHVQRRRSEAPGPGSVREVVDDVHLVTPRKQRVDDVGADETGTAGDDRPSSP